MKQPKRIGRPTKDPAPGKRASLGLKVTSELKKKLEQAAWARGRTQSQEAELRLEQSFDREELLGDVLTIAYGKTVAGLLMMLGEAMLRVAHASGILRSRHDIDGTWLPDDYDWTGDPFVYDQAVRAATHILEAGRPPEPPEAPTPDDFEGPPFARDLQARLIRQLGLHEARSMVLAVQGKPQHSKILKDEGERIRKVLGPFADRLRYPDDEAVREITERTLTKAMREIGDGMGRTQREREAGSEVPQSEEDQDNG